MNYLWYLVAVSVSPVEPPEAHSTNSSQENIVEEAQQRLLLYISCLLILSCNYLQQHDTAEEEEPARGEALHDSAKNSEDQKMQQLEFNVQQTT